MNQINLCYYMFKLIENLDNYFILNQEGEIAIIGTKLIVNATTKSKHPFSPYRHPVDIEFPVFFLIIATEKKSKINKYFIKNRLHILYLNEDEGFPQTAEEYKEILDDFVEKAFRV